MDDVEAVNASDGQAMLNPFASVGLSPMPHPDVPPAQAVDLMPSALAVLVALACIGAMLKKLLD